MTKQSRWLSSFLVALVLAGAGCLETDFIDAPPLAGTVAADGAVDGKINDAGDTLVDGVAKRTSDAKTDAKAEVAQADTVDVTTKVDAADGVVEDTGPAGLPLGHTCTDVTPCESGLCLTVADGVKVCTKGCQGGCPAGMNCTLNPQTGSSAIYYCMPLAGDLCKPCKTDSDCTVGLCQTIESSGQSLCGLPCGAQAGGAAACPSGFVCQSFVKGELCVPTLGTCECNAATQDKSWGCGVRGPKGECVGTQTCSAGEWGQCSAPLPAPEKCDGIDNNCDGQVDEGLGLIIDGVKVSLGGPCGKGVCVSGVVVCDPTDKAACSTDTLSIPKDICGDLLDNDCDGETDEGCLPKDTDGDKSPDKDDCAPYDAAIHPGAKEPCCLALAASQTEAAVDVSEGTKACDWNCDLKVKTCLITDKDGDGFATPDDCNDGDPTIHPGGKEKCGDNIDQDCLDGDKICAPGQDGDGDGWPVGVDCNDSSKAIYPGAPEVCNFIDDDCDGVVDDGNPGGYCADPKTGKLIPEQKDFTNCVVVALGQWFKAGDKCGGSVGGCQPGTLVCTHVDGPAQVTCTDEKGPQPELCNGVDDNCDGKTDEDFTDLGQACDGDDIDECENGAYVCGPDGVAVICGIETKFDLLEQCSAADPTSGNGKDEDCDGAFDETCYGDDVDGDGSPAALDCNDADAAFNPAAKETQCCDPVLQMDMVKALAKCDYNCDQKVNWCDPADLDLDGKIGAEDCNEGDPTVNVDAYEKCGDGIDQDCDKVDLACNKISDNDGDGYGPATGGDCNDANPNVHPNAAEKCNRKDDDCDGVTDEGNPEATPGPCGSSDGVCQPGTEVCVQQKFKAVLLCVPKVPPTAELCDNLDNNCNGKVDEYFPKVGQPCDSPDDGDKCAHGTWQCAGDGSNVVCDNEIKSDIVEICDGIDNDCDGQTDEAMTYFGKPIGIGCTGQGACGQGVVVCSPELQVAVCSSDAWGTEPQSTAELCDGIDNDCDGFTDEGMNFDGKGIGAACFGNGACGVAQGVVQCAADKVSAICSTMLGGKDYKGTKETCDGLDNDCDGHVDDDLTIQDSDCNLGGLCSADNVGAKCIGGKWQCNYDEVIGYQPDKEVLCDGVDNDCDGKTDEEFNVGMACDGTDTDLCKNGVVSCSEDKLFSLCGAESKLDIVEICNGSDDDCDGQVDEGFDIFKACDGPDTDMCANGTWTCTSDGKDHECINEAAENLEEVCDAADNDCDGQIDEGFSDLGAACDGEDSDKCENGVKVCGADKKSTICGKEKVEDIKETCTGADDDCDGQTDEGQKYEGKNLGASCQGKHEGNNCGPGKVVCSPGKKIATCSSNPDAFLVFDGTELCDKLDNDCDGKIDEELAWKGIKLGAQCDPPGDVCGVGAVECNSKSKQVTCSTLSDGTKPQASKEVCDGKDNDCDGKKDEELGIVDSNCKVKGLCSPETVKASCEVGAWKCDYSGVFGYESVEVSCDGIDNDCDGQTDEGFKLGKPCDGKDADQCKNGTWKCAANGKGAVCENELMENIPEVCDGKDNDCDGKKDEDFTYGGLPLGSTCDGVGECGKGKVICGKKQLAVCSTDPEGTNPQGKKETCNGKDDDCDGKKDEDFTYGGVPMGQFCSGIGACGLGKVVCSTQKPVATCSTNPDGTEPKVKPELCNLKDDDCDGQKDEDVDKAQTSCNTKGVCAKALTTACVAGNWTCAWAGNGYEKGNETKCDDLDNNCDGVVDEMLADKGKACDGPDPDECKKGVLICAPTADKLVCGPEKGGASSEICDGIDNDCNGKVDEKFPELGQVCDGPDTDSCANGTFNCAPGGKTVQCINEFPKDVKEVCDGVDNDCDGKKDEDFAIGTPCDGPDADKCKFGAMMCGKDGQPVCGPESKENIKEICNKLDDDCDGQVDEGFANLGEKCGSPKGVDDCKTGVWQCGTSGVIECVGDYECAIGTACQTGANSKAPDKCVCGSSTLCSEAQGDSCDSKICTCGGGATCGKGKVCESGKCK